MNSQPNSSGLYPISTVSSITGVNAITLRAWERRYGLLKPMRTEAGHRLYTDADIDLIKNILALLDEGIAISRVTDALKNVRQQETAEQDEGPWQRYQTTMLEGVAGYNEGTLETVYNEAMSLYPVDMVTKKLLLPLMKILGKRWTEEKAGIAEEHFFSVFIRNKLGARFHHRNLQNRGPRILAACLPGELHEFGLLLFALSAHARGYRVILLGADMPLAQLSEVVERSQSDAIVLSGSSSSVTEDIDEDISALISICNVPVFIGGSFALKHAQSLEDMGAHSVGDDLIVGLHAIGKQLPVNPGQ